MSLPKESIDGAGSCRRGAGYVGSHCVKAAAAAGHACTVFDNLVSGHRDFVRWGPLIVGDIRDAAALDLAFKSERFDAVVHFAALAYVGQSVTAPGRYYDVNVNGTRMLLDAMLRAGVSNIVFSSSCAVYGTPDRLPISETTATEPINPYGRTKLVCEQMMEDFGEAHGLRSMRLRYFNAAGGDPAGEIGEDHDPETHLIPIALDVASGRRPALAVYGRDYATPDGTAVRDYVHVSDLARAHVMALAHVLGSGASMSLNLGTGACVSVATLAAAVERVTGREVATVAAPRRAGDPAELVASPARTMEVLGWRAKHSSPDMILADAWSWHRRRFRK